MDICLSILAVNFTVLTRVCSFYIICLSLKKMWMDAQVALKWFKNNNVIFASYFSINWTKRLGKIKLWRWSIWRKPALKLLDFIGVFSVTKRNRKIWTQSFKGSSLKIQSTFSDYGLLQQVKTTRNSPKEYEALDIS